MPFLILKENLIEAKYQLWAQESPEFLDICVFLLPVCPYFYSWIPLALVFPYC